MLIRDFALGEKFGFRQVVIEQQEEVDDDSHLSSAFFEQAGFIVDQVLRIRRLRVPWQLAYLGGSRVVKAERSHEELHSSELGHGQLHAVAPSSVEQADRRQAPPSDADRVLTPPPQTEPVVKGPSPISVNRADLLD